jgi:hypothetical protein
MALGGGSFDMVAMVEIVFVIVCVALAAWWYLRTPMHKARKHSNVFPPQVAGHGGFGMYTPSDPPRQPQGLHNHQDGSPDTQ